MIYISSLWSKMIIHPARKAQLALLLAKKVTFLAKYSDFANMFSEESTNVLSEQTKANKHTIKFEEGKQLSYEPIYRLEPVELKTFKTYIETNLANGFIKASKSPARAPILFVRKANSSFCLCINYQGLNNLIIKNWYLLPLISKSLDRLSQAKLFTQLDLMSAYHKMRIKEGEE